MIQFEAPLETRSTLRMVGTVNASENTCNPVVVGKRSSKERRKGRKTETKRRPKQQLELLIPPMTATCHLSTSNDSRHQLAVHFYELPQRPDSFEAKKYVLTWVENHSTPYISGPLIGARAAIAQFEPLCTLPQVAFSDASDAVTLN